jgi:subtilisin family serine protease
MRLAFLFSTLFFSLSASPDFLASDMPKTTALQTKSVTDRYQVAPAVRAFKGEQIRIAIIDTGYNPLWTNEPLKLCKKGHYDFLKDKAEVGYTEPHGSIVASIIAEELRDVNYCAVIYQVMGPQGLNTRTIKAAFNKAKHEGLAAINLSLNGRAYSFMERRSMKAVADRGTMIFTAAGNERLDLNTFCNSFPACYPIPNMYVVGATERDNEYPAPYSNYGKRVDIWMPGDYEIADQIVEGTSFAAPRALSDYVYSLYLVQAKQ